MRRLTSELVGRLVALPAEARAELIRSMSQRQLRALLYTWEVWARPNQVWRPSHRTFTTYLAGRGWGKTRVGAQAAVYVARHPELCGGRKGKGGIMGIAGRTANDVSQTMIHGVSGIMACSPPDFRPEHVKSEKLLRWPNGCIARLFSGEEPDSFRGPNIGWLWADELAHWTRLAEAWKSATFMLRHGAKPRCVITTTPLGVQTILEIVFELVDGNPFPAPHGTPDDRQVQGFLLREATEVIGGSTYENAANLAPDWMTEVIARNAGTEAAAQEIEGRILLGSPNAIWQWSWIRRAETVPADDVIDAVVLGIDPALTSAETSSEVGLVIVGFARSGAIYLLYDMSGHYSPEGWASRVEFALTNLGVTHIAYEDNAGGDLIESVLRSCVNRVVLARARKKRCRATRDKATRAAIVAPLWEVGRVVHVGSPRDLAVLEAQMRNFDPSKPQRSQRADRIDALVWAVLSQLTGGSDRQAIQALGSKAAWDTILKRIGELVA